MATEPGSIHPDPTADADLFILGRTSPATAIVDRRQLDTSRPGRGDQHDVDGQRLRFFDASLIRSPQPGSHRSTEASLPALWAQQRRRR